MSDITTYKGKNFVAWSQAMNALCDGNPDTTISSRIGKNNLNNPNRFWGVCRFIVDTTFYPVDGKGHCNQGYEKDKNEDWSLNNDAWYFLVLMFIIILTSCLIIGTANWIMFLIKKFK